MGRGERKWRNDRQSRNAAVSRHVGGLTQRKKRVKVNRGGTAGGRFTDKKIESSGPATAHERFTTKRRGRKRAWSAIK